jgi:hypothetical protein
MFGKQQNLNKSILEVARQTGFDGKDWTGLAQELDERGIRTAGGRPFTANNLRHYCQRQKLSFEIDLPVRKDLHQGQEQNPLSSEEIVTLREIISWWESRRMGLETVERRPVFKGQTRNTGIKINEELLNRAVQKARKERLRTGGSFSGLVEWLIWKYLDEPDDLIESQ